MGEKHAYTMYDEPEPQTAARALLLSARRAGYEERRRSSRLADNRHALRSRPVGQPARIAKSREHPRRGRGGGDGRKSRGEGRRPPAPDHQARGGGETARRPRGSRNRARQLVARLIEEAKPRPAPQEPQSTPARGTPWTRALFAPSDPPDLKPGRTPESGAPGRAIGNLNKRHGNCGYRGAGPMLRSPAELVGGGRSVAACATAVLHRFA